MTLHRRGYALMVCLGLIVGVGPLAASQHATAASTEGGAEVILQVEWSDGTGGVSEGSDVDGIVGVTAGRAVVITFTVAQGLINGIPTGCRSSSVVRTMSYISDSGDALTCSMPAAAQPRSIEVSVQVTGGVGDTLAANADLGGKVAELPDLQVGAGAPQPSRELRILSSPDFLNADLADLRRGPGDWTPASSTNGIDPAYRRAIDTVMDNWQAHKPDDVLVEGDLVDGRWGRDDHHTGNFGPLATLTERKAALRLAARTYYPQWLQRFQQRHLKVFPLMGDHEYGDNPWPANKRALASSYEAMFAKYFTRTPSGAPRFVDRPHGEHEFTAYAFRPHPDVQVIALDDFDIRPGHARVSLDPDQLHWVAQVLRRARKDGVAWTIVTGHVPILEPVRYRDSSDLHYAGGQHSPLWRLLRRYHVNAYLCGEVHDTTAIMRDGVLQLSHGGAFQFGLTTYALLDFYADHLDVTLNDYDSVVREAAGGARLWETVRDGIPKNIHIDPKPFTIGTMSLSADGVATNRTGILLPWKGQSSAHRGG